MSVIAAYPLALASLAMVALMWLGACTQTARNGIGPSQFLEARVDVLAYDMIEVQASVMNPKKGQNTAYADCVAAQFSLGRQNPYVRRITTKMEGRGDIIIENTTYLLSPVAPGGNFVLNAQQIVDRCRVANVPLE